MAPPNGNTSTTTIARKRLVQPVLPALPVLVRDKKAPTKTEDRKEVNGTKSQQSTGKGTERDVEASKSTIFEHVQNGGSASANSEACAESHDNASSVSQNEDSGQDLSNNSPILTPVNTTDESNSKGVTGLAAAAELSATPDVAAPVTQPLEEPVARRSLILDNRQEDQFVANTEDRVNGNAHSSDNAPEAIAGNSQVSQFSPRSGDRSVGASSIYDTPNYAATPPAASGAFLLMSANTLPNENGNGHTAPELVSNGPVTPLKSVTMSNGVDLSPIRPGAVPTILGYIANLEHSREWSDCEFQVVSPNNSSSPLIRHVHSLILLRSERLRSMLYPMRAQSYVYFTIPLFPARPIDPGAFDAALRFFYADTVLSAERLLPSHTVMDKVGKTHALDYILSYMVAGLELGVEPVVGRSFDLLGRLLDWGLAELVIKEAMSIRTVSATAPHPPLEVGIAVDTMFQSVFGLFITQLDVQSFRLDTTATPIGMVSRFTHFEVARAPVNPALANMVFGSMPASTSPSPPASPSEPAYPSSASPDTIASVIMLNLEFNELCVLARGLKKVHGGDGLRLIQGVVKERERRRLSIHENKSISNKQRLANQNLWDIVGWREYMADGALHRDRVGFLLGNNNKRGTYIRASLQPVAFDVANK